MKKRGRNVHECKEIQWSFLSCNNTGKRIWNMNMFSVWVQCVFLQNSYIYKQLTTHYVTFCRLGDPILMKKFIINNNLLQAIRSCADMSSHICHSCVVKSFKHKSLRKHKRTEKIGNLFLLFGNYHMHWVKFSQSQPNFTVLQNEIKMYIDSGKYLTNTKVVCLCYFFKQHHTGFQI